MTTKPLFGILIVCFVLAGTVQAQSNPTNGQAGAAFLSPISFPSLGPFNPASNVMVNATIGRMSGGATFTGVRINQAGVKMLVFSFSSFTLNSGLSIQFSNYDGSIGIAFLSRSNMSIAGGIDASDCSVQTYGAGGGGSATFNGTGGGGGGGGFGGAGSAGQGTSLGPITPGTTGGSGGGTYAPDLTGGLFSGSIGGSGSGGGSPGAGGFGGGALQFGAFGEIDVTGSISVNGGGGQIGIPSGGLGKPISTTTVGCGGGGSGGGILFQAGSINIETGGVLSANGGAGGFGFAPGFGEFAYSGGGGGGGRIVVAYRTREVNNGKLTASGASPGTVIFVQNSDVPGIPPPVLTGQVMDAGQIVLSWPADTVNYVLQMSTSIAVGSTWENVTGTTLVGSNFVLTNQISGNSRFFRLVSQ